MLAICSRRLVSAGVDHYRVIQSPLEALDPILLGRFDVVLCSSVLEYVGDQAGCLRVLHDLLENDGTLLVSWPNRRSVARLRERVTYRLTRRPAYFRYVKNIPSHAAIGRLLQSAGLVIEETRHYGTMFPKAAKIRIPSPAFLAALTCYVCSRADTAA